MLKLAVALAAGIVVIFPSSARADESSGSTARRPAIDAKNLLEGRESGKSWLRNEMPLDLMGEKECNGKSVDDFLKGKCNKLHGYDVKPTLPNAKRFGDRFKGMDSFIQEAGGKAFHSYGIDGTAPTQPIFMENRIYQHMPGYENLDREVPLFGPREQKLLDAKPITK